MRGVLLTVSLLALLAAASPVSARVIRAESVLPPGQSGFVSVPGVVSGTGSPHLTDQTALFTGFGFKNAGFNRPGTATSPRAGVRIVRDSYGVPAVTGATDYDAWWGVGYAVAEDRLFELELFRRATSGRLAEILGSDYLDDDLIARRDFYTDAEVDEMVARVPARERRRGEAYRDGINAYTRRVRLNPTLLPGEYAGLATLPADWTERDTARVGIYLARTVPSSDGVELDNARALRGIGPRAFKKLLPLRNKGRITTVPKGEGRFPSQPGRTRRHERRAFRRSVRYVRGLNLPSSSASAATAGARGSSPPILPRKGGSYMWAIRAPGNQAYLFNGPQLGFAIPELFVEFEVHSPDQNVRGVSAPGVPLIAIGHNGNVAWGFTSGLSDEDDLFAEELTGRETYRFNGRTLRMDCRNEVFRWRAQPTSLPDLVLGGEEVSGRRTERLCRTVHGPVQARAAGVAYARRYAIWKRELKTSDGLSALSDARNINDVNAALNEVTWNENVIAADSQGNIGYWHPGLHPLRSRRYDERLPYPGTGRAEWRGLLPRTQTPRVINPSQGYLISWNNMPSFGWTNGDAEARERATASLHRSRWLRHLVRKVHAKPSYLASRQIDIPNGTTAQQRPFMTRKLRRAARRGNARAREILRALIAWDGSYHRTDSRGTVDPGVAIWEEFKDQAEAIALRRLLPARVPVSAARRLAGGTGGSHEFDISLGESYALRTLKPRHLRRAALAVEPKLRQVFGTAAIARWREPRRMYDITVQGAAAAPELPFFDRGTWEQSVWLGP